MIIVGCRLKGRPNNLQCFDFCRPKKGCRSEIPNSKKMIKGQENHFADWIISFGLKGGALYICSEVCFPAHSFARVWRQTSQDSMRWLQSVTHIQNSWEASRQIRGALREEAVMTEGPICFLQKVWCSQRHFVHTESNPINKKIAKCERQLANKRRKCCQKSQDVEFAKRQMAPTAETGVWKSLGLRQ